MAPGRWHSGDTQETRQELMVLASDFWALRQWGYKSFLFSSWRHPAQSVICCNTVKLFWGAWPLRLCYGKPGVELVGKPHPDCVSVGCAGSQEGHWPAHGSPLGMVLRWCWSDCHSASRVVRQETLTLALSLHKKETCWVWRPLWVAQILKGKVTWKIVSLQEGEMFTWILERITY